MELPETIRKTIAAGNPEMSNLMLDAFFQKWTWGQFAAALRETKTYADDPELQAALKEWGLDVQ